MEPAAGAPPRPAPTSSSAVDEPTATAIRRRRRRATKSCMPSPFRIRQPERPYGAPGGEYKLRGSRRLAWPADPHPLGRDDDAQADSALHLTPLPEGERLQRQLELGGDVRRHVADLDASCRVPDRDRIRIVLVFGFRYERDLFPGCEGVVFERVAAIRGPDDGQDACAGRSEPLVVPAERITRCRIAQPESATTFELASLEPDA